MSEERNRVLNMLAEGKITADEAATLLDALEARSGSEQTAGAAPKAPAVQPGIKGDPGPLMDALPKYLFVKVISADGDNVDVKVPVALVRSGLKLTSLIPPQAMDQINDSMKDSGISIDFSNLKPEDIDEIVEALRETEINVNAKNGDNVRVYCA